MIALARFIMAGPSQAALVAAVTAILALMLPPLAWVSGGVIALVVLHLGPGKGMQLIVLAGIAAMGLSWLVLGTPMLSLGVILLLWLPLWLTSVVLRQTVSLGLSLQLIAGLGVAFVLTLDLGFPQIQQQLAAEFAEMIRPVIEQQPSEAAQAELIQAMDTVLKLLPGILAIGMIFGVVLSLLLGRWWQAALYNPGGLTKEFNELRLGRILPMLSVVLILLSVFTGSDLMTMLMLVLLSLYMIQGFAIVHGIIELRKISKGWLIGLYIMVFMLPHLVVFPLAVFGLSDAWIDFRKRLTTN